MLAPSHTLRILPESHSAPQSLITSKYLLSLISDKLSHPLFSPFTFSYTTMSVARATRSSKAIMTKGLGQHFTSPRKPQDKKKRCMAIPVPGNGSKQQKLLDELKDLLTPQPLDTKLSPSTIDWAASPIHKLEEPPEAPPMELDNASFTIDTEDESCSVPTERVRTVCPTARSISMCASWKALILTLDLFSSTRHPCLANHYWHWVLCSLPVHRVAKSENQLKFYVCFLIIRNVTSSHFPIC